MKFKKSLGNINYSTFPAGVLNYEICVGEVENSNFFSREWFNSSDFYRRINCGRFSPDIETGYSLNSKNSQKIYGIAMKFGENI